MSGVIACVTDREEPIATCGETCRQPITVVEELPQLSAGLHIPQGYAIMALVQGHTPMGSERRCDLARPAELRQAELQSADTLSRIDAPQFHHGSQPRAGH